MKQQEKQENIFSGFRGGGRREVRVSPQTMVSTGYLQPDQPFPLVLRPNIENVNLVTWAGSNRQYIETQLLKHGAILFRSFDVRGVNQFEQLAKVISSELLDYTERAAPRTEVGRKIYTSTEYPSNQHIPLHHEMSYSHNWPTKIWFYCSNPAEQGGRTPIANDREVFNLISPKIKEKFIALKVMYVRNFGEGVDLSWQEAFQTNDRAVVEEYCRKSHMQFEWRDKSRLRTRQIRQAVAIHPETGETVWFNHAHMFHISNLDPLVRTSLLSEFKDDELPRNAFYGDGSVIETSVLDEIRGIYQNAAIRFTWQKGDILMLDNFLASHGREPYTGARKILVAMAELYTNKDIG